MSTSSLASGGRTSGSTLTLATLGVISAPSGPPPAPLVSVEKTTVGSYKGRPALQVEVMDYFRETNIWRRLPPIPADAFRWALINESRTSTIDVSYEDLPDPVSPPCFTIPLTTDSKAKLESISWRPNAMNIRGTINKQYYFYYIIPDEEHEEEARPRPLNIIPKERKKKARQKKRAPSRISSKKRSRKRTKRDAKKSEFLKYLKPAS